jgi:hypothetical protein
MNDWSRRTAFIDAVEASDHQPATILGLVSSLELTMADFVALDETPGEYDHRYREHRWHTALRRVRNDPTNDLFDRLNA